MFNELEGHVYPFMKLVSKLYKVINNQDSFWRAALRPLIFLLIWPLVIFFALLNVIDWALVFPIRAYIVSVERYEAINRPIVRWLMILPIVSILILSVPSIIWMTPAMIYDHIKKRRNTEIYTRITREFIFERPHRQIELFRYKKPSDEGGDMVKGRLLKHKL